MSSPQMQQILSNDATIQGLVFSWTQGGNSQYAVFDDVLIPDQIKSDSGTIEIDIKQNTINHFNVGDIDLTHRVIDRPRQVSCRGYTITKAETLRDAVINALNRVRSSDGKAFFSCTANPTLPPSDKTDNYNAPITVRTISMNC